MAVAAAEMGGGDGQSILEKIRQGSQAPVASQKQPTAAVKKRAHKKKAKSAQPETNQQPISRSATSMNEMVVSEQASDIEIILKMEASNKETQQIVDVETSIDVPPPKKRQKAKPVEVVKKESKNVSENKSSIRGNVLNVEEIRLSLARMVIIDELPFKFVEGEGFRVYSRALEPSFEVPLGTQWQGIA
ncbi:hypothetical protein Salat_2097200 [Sesamum alatum]|uniref:Uncharacterized protein n=1 Tax=Sesamum alatum TaxID=300844 RepID=A0AAE1Y0E4_9LAMI|nr:hypothetical protein Salat_2097200 [Sesamum alatum]